MRLNDIKMTMRYFWNDLVDDFRMMKAGARKPTTKADKDLAKHAYRLQYEILLKDYIDTIRRKLKRKP